MSECCLYSRCGLDRFGYEYIMGTCLFLTSAAKNGEERGQKFSRCFFLTEYQNNTLLSEKVKYQENIFSFYV